MAKKEEVVPEAVIQALQEFNDDAKFLVNGKETTWKEHSQGFIPQSEYTKSRQADADKVKAQIAQETETLRQQAQAYADQRAQQMFAQWQTQTAQQQQATRAQEQVAASKELGYATHEQLGPLVEGFQAQIAQLQAENHQVINTMNLMQQQAQHMSTQYNPLLEQSSSAQLDTVIADAAKRLGINDAGVEHFGSYAKNLHSAYEGDDLDEKYPDMLDEAWKNNVAAVTAAQKAEVAAVRQGLSSNGGAASPSGALNEDDLEPGNFWTDEQDSDEGEGVAPE